MVAAHSTTQPTRSRGFICGRAMPKITASSKITHATTNTGSDRCAALAERARGRDPRRLREAAERCEDVRQSLELNVSEDLALAALSLRLASLVGSAG